MSDSSNGEALEPKVRSATNLLVAAAVTIYPAWTLFDVVSAPEWWRLFAALRFAEAAAIAVAFALWRARRVAADTVILIAFGGMAGEIAFMCGVVPVEALAPYFLGFSTLFLAVGIVILWPPRGSVIVLAIALTALVVANASGAARSTTAIMEHGGLMFLTLAVVSILVTQLRWNMVREEIETRGKLEAAHRAVERQAAELATSNRDLDRFARAVSHDLKTPISQMSLALSVLEDPSFAELDRDEILRHMRRCIVTASRTIDELLSAAQRPKETNAEDRATDIVDVYTELETLLAEEIRSAGGRMSGDFRQCRTVPIDRGKLRSVLLNLLTNAVKYRSPERPLAIHVSTSCVSGGVEVSVSDNGRGIDLADAKKSPLPDLGRRHPEIPGSGLGLGFIKQAIEAEGGRIEIESAIDRGTTLHVWLPDADRPRDAGS